MVEIIQKQQERMKLYKMLLDTASCEEERKALLKTYEISRLIFIKHEDVIERSSFMLEKR